MPNKTAILLDLGGVVFESSGVSNDCIDWSVINELNHKYGHDFNIGKDVFPSFLKDYNQRTGQHLKGEDFLKNVFDTLHFNKELVEYLGSQYEIIIVSDNYKENIAYISKRFQFHTWANKQFYSFDFGLEKSDPKFFQILLDRIEQPADELVLIDDSPIKLESASRSGIDGILFVRNHQVFDSLESL